MALLEVRDLSVTIGSLQPLDRVTFSVDKGSILGLVGESGSGKSLTAMALMGHFWVAESAKVRCGLMAPNWLAWTASATARCGDGASRSSPKTP